MLLNKLKEKMEQIKKNTEMLEKEKILKIEKDLNLLTERIHLVPGKIDRR